MSILETETVPLATEVETSEDELTVSLADGRRISVPLAWFPRLLNATPEERSEFQLLGGGEGIHWPRVDEDISVAGLLRGSRARRANLREVRNQETHTKEYRRSDGDNTWHWNADCSAYPSEDYFVRHSTPAANLCAECDMKSQG